MKARIYSSEFLIGTTELRVGDKSMGSVFGDFQPTELYFSKVQKDVWEFWKTNKPNYEKWNSLRFNAQLQNGLFLFPQGGYTFDDIGESSDDPIRIDLTGIDNKIIEDYFLVEPARQFTEEPWSEIDIGQKIAFENELSKELGNNKKSLFNILKKKSSSHKLMGTEFSAFCHDQRNDDVLFEIRQDNGNEKFAVAHLTWSGKKEKEGYPNTKLFMNFDDFKHLKMNPDKIEWES